MIIFIRHGETDYNVKGLLQGKINIPLNKHGQEEAIQVAEKLKDLQLDRIFSSPLDRAKDTASYINKYHNLPINIDDRIIEIGFGAFEGKQKDMVTKLQKLDRKQNPEKYGAEKQEDIKARVIDFYNSIKDLSGNTLIVSHGGIFKVLARYLNIYNDVFINNCEVFVIKK